MDTPLPQTVLIACQSCRWFLRRTKGKDPMPFGLCRRHAPTMQGHPVVWEQDSCGDYMPREEGGTLHGA
jgi:hypothetical protein